MFWTKFVELCEGQGLKPRKIAAEFDVAPATVTRWKHGSVPRADTLEKIAARLGVTSDFMLSEEEYMINPSEKRSTFKKITAASVICVSRFKPFLSGRRYGFFFFFFLKFAHISSYLPETGTVIRSVRRLSPPLYPEYPRYVMTLFDTGYDNAKYSAPIS